MKKLLVFFMVLFGISLGAMADPTFLFGNQGGNPCVEIPYFEDQPYAIYFKTGDSTVSHECASYFDKVKSELQQLWSAGNVQCFVVVASADKQGDERNYDNTGLSGKRFKYAKENILPEDDQAYCESGSWATGSASANVFEPQYTASWNYRSVYIYPVWKLPECDGELVNGINESIDKLEKAKKDYPNQTNEIDKILANYNRAHELCPEAGKKLGAEDAEKLAKYLKDAVVLAGKSNTDFGLTDVTVIITDIDKHYYNLTKMVSGLKLSVWRDENGNFNTARLVSDSIAGVVLGTVGGIVTSKLVKKNQLKKGFEDLSCAVGGQTVAGYGDDFTVGLR